MKSRFLIIFGTGNLIYTHNALRLFDGSTTRKEDWNPYREFNLFGLPIYVLIMRKELPHGKELAELRIQKRKLWVSILIMAIYFAFAVAVYYLLFKG